MLCMKISLKNDTLLRIPSTSTDVPELFPLKRLTLLRFLPHHENTKKRYYGIERFQNAKLNSELLFDFELSIFLKLCRTFYSLQSIRFV